MLNSKMESGSLTASGSDVCARNRSLSRSKQSAKLCAGSMLIISVRCPSSASFMPVAAAKLVFPTPPLPVNITIRIPHYTAVCFLAAHADASFQGQQTRAHRSVRHLHIQRGLIVCFLQLLVLGQDRLEVVRAGRENAS